MAIAATVVVEVVGIVGVLAVKTMVTEGRQGARHIEVEVAITLLPRGAHHRTEVVAITLLRLGAPLMAVGQEGTELDHLHIPHIGVLKGTMPVARSDV